MQKTIWITGASSGIGREFARRYARLGFRLILTARRTDRLEALAAELTVKYNTFCRILPADLEQESECARLFEALADERLDIFINNAGFGVCGSFLETSGEKELSMAKVNVLAMHQLFKFAVKKMEAQGFGTVLAQYVTSNTGSKVTAVVSNGSQDNIEQMGMNTAQLGFVQSDVMSYAYNGERLFEGMADTSFSTVAALYMEQVQIVTCDPSIQSVADLKGKNVSIGASGSGVYYNALDVLSAYGLSESDISATYQDFGNSVDALQDGKIDAAFVVAGAPTTAITDLATASSVYLVSIDDEHMDTLLASSPYYARSIISADTYGTPDDVQTVAVAAVVLVRDDVSADAVYKFVSTIFENSGSIQHGKAEELSVEFGSSITAVPYHPGAAKYFAEKGIEVATK